MSTKESKEQLKSLRPEEFQKVIEKQAAENQSLLKEVEELRLKIEAMNAAESDSKRKFKTNKEKLRKKRLKETSGAEELENDSSSLYHSEVEATEENEEFSDAGDAAKILTNQISALKGIEKPEKFSGRREISVVETFIYQIENYMELINIPETKQLALFSMFLKDTALKWFRSLELNLSPKEFKRLDLKSVLKLLKEEFCPDDPNELARERLYSLYHGQSYKYFLDSFRDICLDISDMSKSEKFHTFKRKLKPEYLLEVRKARVTTFEEAVEVANSYDLSLRKKSDKNYKIEKNLYDQNFVSSEKSSTDKNQMRKLNLRINSIQDSEKRKLIDSLPRNEKIRRLKEKLCLNCARKNCVVSTCTQDFVRA